MPKHSFSHLEGRAKLLWRRLSNVGNPLLKFARRRRREIGSVLVACLSLWTVGVLTGLFDRGDDAPNLALIVDIPEGTRGGLNYALSRGLVFASIELISRVEATPCWQHAPMQFLKPKRLLTDKFGYSVVRVSLWRDKELTLPLDSLPSEVDSDDFSIELASTRTLQDIPSDRSIKLEHYEQQREEIGPTPATRPVYTLTDKAKLIQHQYAVLFRLDFTSKLDGGRGLATLIWRQALTAKGEKPGTPLNFLKSTSTVIFDPKFDDVHSPSTANGLSKSDGVSSVSADSPTSPFSWPVAIASMRGTDSEAKDLVDFVVFAMAALFGAAAAALFDVVTKE